MSLYRVVVLVVPVVLSVGCVASDDAPVAWIGPDDERPSPVLVATVDPLPSDRASCAVVVEPFTLADESCAALVTVTFTCDAARPQSHSWARVGLLCDGEVCAYDDVEYACDAQLARSFAYPCGASALVGGATFDHPRTAADVSCTSE